jgi:hypothetical protein
LTGDHILGASSTPAVAGYPSITVAASWLPARNATRLDVMETLISALLQTGLHSSRRATRGSTDAARRRDSRWLQGLPLFRVERYERAEKAMINSQPPTPDIQWNRFAGIVDVWELEIGIDAAGFSSASYYYFVTLELHIRPETRCDSEPASDASQATAGKTLRRCDVRPGRGPGRSRIPRPAEAFSRVVERFAEQRDSGPNPAK